MNTILSFFEDKQEFCYTVLENERLIDIAFKFSISVSDLIALNKLKAEVIPGQILYIKRGDYIVITPENFNNDYGDLLEKNNKKAVYIFDILKK